MTLAAIGVGAAMALTAVPAAADVKAGVDAWSRGDYAGAVKQWQVLADKGDADAQFNLAQAYKLGRGVPQDLAHAEALYGKAAAQGHMQAADNYGLLMYQRGEHAKAMPYIKAGSEHGDPRSQYLYGIALFNGEGVTKDWVKAYALVNLAQQQGLSQAQPALTQMDQYIPLDQRQKGIAVATELATQAEANRQRQLAAMDLGTRLPAVGAHQAAVTPPLPVASAPPRTPLPTATALSTPDPLARHAVPAVGHVQAPPTPAPQAMAAMTPARTVSEAAAPSSGAGTWKVQLGAFGVSANADSLWARLHARPEIAGHARLGLKSGAVTRLLAGGYSETAARAACSRLAAAGIACMAVAN